MNIAPNLRSSPAKARFDVSFEQGLAKEHTFPSKIDIPSGYYDSYNEFSKDRSFKASNDCTICKGLVANGGISSIFAVRNPALNFGVRKSLFSRSSVLRLLPGFCLPVSQPNRLRALTMYSFEGDYSDVQLTSPSINIDSDPAFQRSTWVESS